MIDYKEALPYGTTIQGKEYLFDTDYKKWLFWGERLEALHYGCDVQNPQEQLKQIQDILNDYYLTPPPIRYHTLAFASLKQFYKKCSTPSFCNDCPQETQEKLFDIKQDADVLYASFMSCYHIDLTQPLHYAKFCALLSGLHDTLLNQIIQYRAYEGKDPYMLKLKRQHALPVTLTAQEQKDWQHFKEIFS